jgi:hypothetical protein
MRSRRRHALREAERFVPERPAHLAPIQKGRSVRRYGDPLAGNCLSKDMKGFAAFWPEAKYGKMRIEGRDPVNA